MKQAADHQEDEAWKFCKLLLKKTIQTPRKFVCSEKALYDLGNMLSTISDFIWFVFITVVLIVKFLILIKNYFISFQADILIKKMKKWSEVYKEKSAWMASGQD